MNKQTKILICVLAIFIVGMTLGLAFAEPVDAKTVKKGKYVGSKNSDKFHKKTCHSAKKIKSYNKITFKSKSQAKKMGYKPCKRCHP